MVQVSAAKRPQQNHHHYPHHQQHEDQHQHDGLPPWHTVVAVMVMGLGFAAFVPSIMVSIDEIATIETLTGRQFPDLVSLQALIIFRLLSCLTIFGWSRRAFYIAYGPTPVRLITPYLPESKLRRNIPLSLHGLYSHAPFTMWSWILLGVSFGLNAYLASCYRGDGLPVPPVWLMRSAILLYEIVAPTTLLVSTVVRYAIWPALLLQNGTGPDPTAPLKLPRVLAYHNLNVILALVESAVMGKMPVRYHHLSVAVFFGILYVLFSWCIRHRWSSNAGPQFLYFFLDTTLGYTTTAALLALLLVLVISYGVFAAIPLLLDRWGGRNIVVHITFVLLVCRIVCRFRD
jgi:hypothetical protein